MKQLVFFILFLVITSSLTGQDFSDDKAYINKELDEKINSKNYYDASDLMIIFAQQLLKHGDTLSSLEYQLRNCELVDNHLDYFKNNGMTYEEYFSNWFVVISLEGWLKRKEESEQHLFSTLKKISIEAPYLLPQYADGLSFIVSRCNNPAYFDKMYLLQKALDIIKNKKPSKEIVQQYLHITSTYYNFCFNNSFDGVIFVNNRLPEIQTWYYKNREYINRLDTNEFKNEIIEYNLEYAEQLKTYASSIGSQLNNPKQAISVYNEEISIIKPLLKYNSKLSQKIAFCYSKISYLYFIIGDKTNAKILSDLTRDYIYNYVENFEYCDILSSLAYNYYMIGNPQLASHYKFIEIYTREKLGWHCTQSDWAMYFMYLNSLNDPKTVLKYHSIALYASDPDSLNCSLLIEIGKANTSLIYENEQYKDTARFWLGLADTIISIKKNNPEKYNYSKIESIEINIAWATYYRRLKQFELAYHYLKKALEFEDNPTYSYYSSLAQLSAQLHDKKGIHEYLPVWYYGLEKEIIEMLPILGSLESESYLGNGEIEPYHLFEWASWNQSDTISTNVAFDAVLLVKNLLLRNDLINPNSSNNDQQRNKRQTLNNLRNNLYIIKNNDSLMIALNQYAQLEREILMQNHYDVVHWKDIKNHLNNKESCIEFVRYTANAYSWSDGEPKLHYAAIVLSGDKEYPVFIDLFDEDELNDVYVLQPKSYEEVTGSILYNKIWGKLDSLITDKDRVYFSPMGMLNLINIELLSDSIGITALEKYNLIRVSSTRQILNYQTSVKALNVVSFGGIDYDNITEVMADNLNTRGNWNYLKNTLSEVRNIEENIKSQGGEVRTLTGSRATEQAFKALDGTDANILHIASHGFYVPMSKWDTIPYYSKSEYTKTIKEELFYSGLVMSGGDKTWTDSVFDADKNDGILTSYEISKVDLHNVELIVLSACETGLGEDLYDGIYGLQRAFKKAGAKSILMSLWNIDDKATSDFMTFFYKHISSGLSNQESYRRTVFEMRKKYQDPYYWASFVLLD